MLISRYAADTHSIHSMYTYFNPDKPAVFWHILFVVPYSVLEEDLVF